MLKHVKKHKLEVHTKIVRPTKYDALEQRQFQHRDKTNKKSRKKKKLKDNDIFLMSKGQKQPKFRKKRHNPMLEGNREILYGTHQQQIQRKIDGMLAKYRK